jgi:phosphate transport system substrate-binding protein
MTMKLPVFAVAALATMLLSGCTSTTGSTDCEPFAGTPATVSIDGSSTVYPIAEAWAEEFAYCAGIVANVAFSGTGGGLQKFCRGEIDVADASRPIRSSETSACQANGITPFEIQVAIDGLAVVVSKQNTFVDNLKVSELNRIWTANASKDLRPEWPDQRIELFGPGTNSGTFDYFVEVIITPFDGSTSKGRSDYTPSEDDHVLVQGVSGTSRGLAYFGLAYAEESANLLRVVPIIQDTKDGGKTFVSGAQPVEPTPANVESGAYAPLSRPLFMYTNGAPQGQLKEWFLLGLSAEGQDVVSEVGYVKLPEAKRAEMIAKIG